MTKKILLVLIFIGCISFFLSIFRNEKAPACFNADEAAFGYNAYSILKTGRDEYGTLLPIRLKSFGDYKLPLYSYFSIPFVATFGLTELSTRALNFTLAFFLPIVVYLLCYELFKNKITSLLTALFIGLSLGIHLISRHAHEALLATTLISLSFYFFLKVLNDRKFIWTSLFSLTILLSLFSYQSSRIFAAFFFIASIIYFFRKKVTKNFLVIFFIALVLFGITDILYNPVRVKNLLLFNSRGFSLNIEELKREGGVTKLHSELIQGIKGVTFQHLLYFSPQYFVTQGDDNPRFGYRGMSLITPLEYLFIFVGLYFLFKNKHPYRFLFLSLFLISPISASLSWNDMSITRSLFILVPAIILSAYGITSIIANPRNQIVLSLALISIYGMFLFLNWEFYLFHYPKRGLITRSWQCGYKELTNYINQNYSKADKFYITKKNGQPYIFMLFYGKYDPSTYQKQARLSPPDQYGFGQVEQFDKYIFDFKVPSVQEKAIAVGYPDDFSAEARKQIHDAPLDTITSNTEQMFLIYNPLK